MIEWNQTEDYTAKQVPALAFGTWDQWATVDPRPLSVQMREQTERERARTQPYCTYVNSETAAYIEAAFGELPPCFDVYGGEYVPESIEFGTYANGHLPSVIDWLMCSLPADRSDVPRRRGFTLSTPDITLGPFPFDAETITLTYTDQGVKSTYTQPLRGLSVALPLGDSIHVCLNDERTRNATL